ncbi:adenosylcobinamide-GDP ribazoletransferase [Hansschlegelia quercus]|uniref:Adenosylcobinamide-GDP ribazoletransferase n=1 Tax=Hansschlegelia quercus TaxID=2528245 RepID=A0A4Q9GBU2_9HYPH|nr:adenosylcobinamide-GDP ribazoletransferase [Hansschlegelia quercus]TBN48620.1 adenosylcobinamide-GDP ribazoletransferase [Hansschlegelia quercus]
MSDERTDPASPSRPFDAVGDALRFFTRLPVPASWGSRDPARIFDGVAAMAPLAGLVIGCGSAAILLVTLALGLPPLGAAAIATAVGVALSGALHQDGLADVADGFGGGKTLERKLAIMRDSGIGAYGASALTLALVARVGLVAGIAEKAGMGPAALSVIAAATLARPLALFPTQLLPPARVDGAGAAARPKALSVSIGVALGALAALALGQFAGAAAIVVALAAAAAVSALARRQIGGYTGDVCGACAEIAEIAALAALAAG